MASLNESLNGPERSAKRRCLDGPGERGPWRGLGRRQHLGSIHSIEQTTKGRS